MAVKFGEVVPDEALQQRHQIGNFLRRSGPVLGRERVKRQVADAELRRRTHGLSQRFDTAAMPLNPGQAPLRRPAAVAVHDNPDMDRMELTLSAGKCRV